MALLSPKLDYIFSLQTVFRGEAGKILLVVLGKLKDIPGKNPTKPNKKFGLKSRFFFRGFFKEMFQIKKKGKLSDSNLVKFSSFFFFQLCFHRVKMKVFDINLQNNHINHKLTFHEGKKRESTISCLGHRVGSEPQHIMAEPLCPDLSWSQDQPWGLDPLPPASVGSKVCASRSTMPAAQGRRK